MARERIATKVRELLMQCGELSAEQITEDTPLIGPGAAIKSRALVELMLGLEDYAEEELGVSFDWTSDSAMSASRSLMRTVGSLTDHLDGLCRSRAA